MHTFRHNLNPLLKDGRVAGRRVHRADGHDRTHPLRELGGQIRHDGAAQRVADDDGLGEGQLVQDAKHVRGDGLDELLVARVGGAPGAVRVEGDAAVLAREERQDGEVVVLRRAEAVDADERQPAGGRALGVRVGVVQLALVDLDVGHCGLVRGGTICWLFPAAEGKEKKRNKNSGSSWGEGGRQRLHK